jgi:AraC-like DNA-binding protein
MDGVARYRIVSAAPAPRLERLVEEVGQLQLHRIHAPPRDAWRALSDEVFRRCPPDGLIVHPDLVTDTGVSVLKRLADVGSPIPTAIPCDEVPREKLPAIVEAVGLEHVALVPSCEEAAVTHVLAYADPPLDVEIARRFAVTCRRAKALLSLLASDGGARTFAAEKVARQIGTNRRTLYLALRKAGLPTVERLQFIFRAEAGLKCLLNGGTVEDSAFRATYGSAANFRRALHRRLGQAPEGVRALGTWAAVLETWDARGRRHGAVMPATSLTDVHDRLPTPSDRHLRLSLQSA